MKLLLVYPPFCTPTVPPYSITYLKSFIKANSKINVKCIDLNAKFHKNQFTELYKRIGKAKDKMVSYSELLEEYYSKAKKVYRANNLAVSNGEKPEYFNEILETILMNNPDVIGFSLVYNSQLQYARILIKALVKKGIVCIIGGPAAENLKTKDAIVLKDDVELLNFLTKQKKHKKEYVLDFSDYDIDDYLSKEMIFPLRSSYGCYYKACAFCTHHCNTNYNEIPISQIKKSIAKNKIKNVFFIDDLISAKRLGELSQELMDSKIKWWCQTRPTKDLLGCFKKFKLGGLVSLSLGVESGNQQILNSMRKGTKVEDVQKVLLESHEAGIKNIVFIIFGFPGETKKSFMDTIKFLKENSKSIDIVSASVFGLQKGSYVYEHPEKYGISRINHKENPLGESITYKVKKGLDESQSKIMKEELMQEIRKINKLPKILCLLKEQTVFY